MQKSSTLLKNSVYNVLYRLLNVLFPLVSATYVARVIFAKGVGEVSYAQNIVAYFTTIAALGIPNYGIREIAKKRQSQTETKKLFSELITINAISTTCCIVLYCFTILFFPSFSDNIALYISVGLLLLFNYINVDWFYQGNEDYSYIAKRSFIIKCFSLLSMFMFVNSKSDVVVYALITSLATGGNNIFNIIHLKHYNIRFQFKGLELKKHIRPILVLLASVIAVEFYTMLDTTMIGIFCGDSAVGYYTNSMKLVKILITVVTAIGGVLLPRLSLYYSKGDIEKCEQVVNKVFRIMLLLFIPCEIGLILTANIVMPFLFGESFLPAVLTLRISALLICTLGFSNLFGTQLLMTFGAERKLLMCTVMGAVSNVIVNLILIPIFQQNGAAVASVISETIVTFMTVIYSSKYIKIRLSSHYIWSLLISSIVMTTVVLVVIMIPMNCLFQLGFSILFGAVSYFGVNFIMRNSDLNDILNMVIKRG